MGIQVHFSQNRIMELFYIIVLINSLRKNIYMLLSEVGKKSCKIYNLMLTWRQDCENIYYYSYAQRIALYP